MAGGDGILREFGKAMYTVTQLYSKRITNKDLPYSTRNSAHVMCQPGWVGDWRENGHSYLYGWVPSLFT